ncbi:hypothetical protein [Chengkuizengella sediminis]|uniref:hypothetical protein n=1 Tax=Chengkuizengella sediminis TaxID=1885917 RepID=UPI001389B9B7|nr:hypothetical protein [Chengkuizengella sediminis]NDI33732.1 hypothetical protein [Chengkuizengella sediminis]
MNNNNAGVSPISNNTNAGISPISNNNVAPISKAGVSPVSNENIGPISKNGVSPISNENISPMSKAGVAPSHMNGMKDVCCENMHRYVMVEMMDGTTQDGFVEGADEENLYLACPRCENVMAAEDHMMPNNMHHSHQYHQSHHMRQFGYGGFGGFGFPGYGYGFPYGRRLGFYRRIFPFGFIRRFGRLPYY